MILSSLANCAPSWSVKEVKPVLAASMWVSTGSVLSTKAASVRREQPLILSSLSFWKVLFLKLARAALSVSAKYVMVSLVMFSTAATLFFSTMTVSNTGYCSKSIRVLKLF